MTAQFVRGNFLPSTRFDIATNVIRSTDLSGIDRVVSTGFLTDGDGGGASWRATGNTGTVGSEDLANGLIYDTPVGNEFAIDEPLLNAKMFGAQGIKTGDDTVAIQNVLTYAGSLTNGEQIYFPGGDYPIDVSSASINVPEGVGIRGPGIYQPKNEQASKEMLGATFFITGTENIAFLTHRGNHIEGVNFYYPDQVLTNPPVAYNWTIEQDTSIENIQGLDIIDCVFINPYKGINLAGERGGVVAGSTFLSKIRMAPLHTGIRIGHSPVPIYYNQIQITMSFWSDSIPDTDPLVDVREWVAANGVGFQIVSSDSIFVSQYTCFGYQYGVKFSGGDEDNVPFCHFTGCTFDGNRYGVRMESGTTVQTAKFTACDFASKEQFTDQSHCIGLSIASTAKVDKVVAAACKFGPTDGTHISIAHPLGDSDGHYNFSACQFETAGRSYANGNGTDTHNITISSENANVTLLNCHFKNSESNIAGVITCIKVFNVHYLKIIGCHFHEHEHVLDFQDGTNLTLIGNSSEDTQGASVFEAIDTTGRFINLENDWDLIGALGTIETFGLVDATPSVARGNLFETSDTTTITDFADGYEGKTIKILALFVATVTNGTNIFTSTAADKAFAVNRVYTYTRIGGKWYENATA